MRYTSSVAVVLALSAIIYLVATRDSNVPSPGSQLVGVVPESTGGFDTKIDDQSPMTVSVKPVELDQGTGIYKFKMVFDTHSGSLDDDLLGTVVLVSDNGVLLKPISWEGSRPGGHHREGVLTFKTTNYNLKQIELKIKDIGGIGERVFRWDIK